PVVGGAIFFAITAVSGLLIGAAALVPILVILLLGYIPGLSGPVQRPGSRIAVLSVGFFFVFSGFGLATFYFEKPAVTKIWARESRVFEKRLMNQARETGAASVAVEDEVRKLVAVFPYLFFGITALSSVWLVGGNYLVTGLLAKSKNYEWTQLPKFSLWQIPWYLAYGFIFGLIGFLFSEYFGANEFFVYAAGLNLLMVFGTLYFVQGFAVVYFFLDKRSMNSLARSAVILLAIFIQVLFQGVSWLGVFDTWFDFRKLATSG
ncbi:MAG TPA: DUF2232 domain-containing protein, partial [Actinobacteria bacterium]|nr:DUF2232 domain-containing protein [Actinomycetota bacterium]